MDERARCRVCLAQKARAELDGTGRCRSCAMAKEATDHHMTYGKYTALLRSRKREEQDGTEGKQQGY